MNIRSATLIGAIQLVSDVDSIGVPIFRDPFGNSIFTLEMDAELRIAEFREFFNEHNYLICYDIPAGQKIRRYDVGDWAPIPFWLGSHTNVVLGDNTRTSFLKQFPAQDNSVVEDMGRLFDDARSGRIKERFDTWAAEGVIAQFTDVFREVPIRSRYWVSRYRRAVEQARRLAQPPHPIDNSLREVATTWLKRFGLKTNLRLIVGMLGNPANGIFSYREVANAVFAFLLEAFHNQDYEQLEIYVTETSLQKWFPDGLLGYFHEFGYPDVPFPYLKQRNFEGVFLDELRTVNKFGNYKRAEKLAFIAFGRQSLPMQVEEELRQTTGLLTEEMNGVEYEAEAVFSMRGYVGERSTLASRLLLLYDQLNTLNRIANGPDRLKGTTYPYLTGYTQDDVDRWEQIRELKF